MAIAGAAGVEVREIGADAVRARLNMLAQMTARGWIRPDEEVTQHYADTDAAARLVQVLTLDRKIAQGVALEIPESGDEEQVPALGLPATMAPLIDAGVIGVLADKHGGRILMVCPTIAQNDIFWISVPGRAGVVEMLEPFSEIDLGTVAFEQGEPGIEVIERVPMYPFRG